MAKSTLNKCRIVLVFTIIFASVILLFEHAQAASQRNKYIANEVFMDIKNRIEFSIGFEPLTPAETYGDWKSMTLMYYRKERHDLTWFAGATGHFRKMEGSGLYLTTGAYKDWADKFATYTSVSAGTSSSYLASLSVDHDFNFKFGKDNRYVWNLGITYNQYFDDHRDLILSTGFTGYLGRWIPEYRVYRNMSNPGSVESFSHTFSLAYGQEKHSWTTLTYSFGQQAYLSTALGDLGLARNASQLVSLEYRRWLGPHHGFFTEVSHFNLADSYTKLGFSLGFFREY